MNANNYENTQVQWVSYHLLWPSDVCRHCVLPLNFFCNSDAYLQSGRSAQGKKCISGAGLAWKIDSYIEPIPSQFLTRGGVSKCEILPRFSTLLAFKVLVLTRNNISEHCYSRSFDECPMWMSYVLPKFGVDRFSKLWELARTRFPFPKIAGKWVESPSAYMAVLQKYIRGWNVQYGELET